MLCTMHVQTNAGQVLAQRVQPNDEVVVFAVARAVMEVRLKGMDGAALQ